MPPDPARVEPSSPEAEQFAPLPTRAVCNRCGSDDVCRDASTRWDAAAAIWALAGVYDECTCQACGADGHDVVDYPPIAPEAGFRVRIKPRERVTGDLVGGRIGTVVRPNRVSGGLFVKLDPRPRERTEKIELVDLVDLEVRA